MGVVLLIVVLLAAVATIASGVWVAIALMAALRHRPGVQSSDPSHSSPHADSSDA